jgi:hypothetical protein
LAQPVCVERRPELLAWLPGRTAACHLALVPEAIDANPPEAVESVP